MTWTKITIADGFFQWSDLERADEWFRELVSRTSDATMATVDGQAFADQAAHVIATWTALSGAFKSMNIPPLACPFYAQPWLDLTRVWDQRAHDCITQWNAHSDHPVTLDSSHLLCYLSQRLSLDVLNADVHDDDARVQPPDLGIGRGRTGTEVGHVTAVGCGRWDVDHWGTFLPSGIPLVPGVAGIFDSRCTPYTWNTAAFSGGETVFGIPAGPICGVVKFLPPLRWFMDLPRKIADAWTAARSSEAFVKLCVQYAILTDIDQANKAGVTPSQVQTASVMLPATLAQLAAAREQDLQRDLAVAGTATAAVVTALAAAASGTAAAGPYGVIAAAVIAILAAIVAAVGIAVGTVEDPWGQPILDSRMTRGWVPWTIYLGTPPTNTPPDPPGMFLFRANIPGLHGLDVRRPLGIPGVTPGTPGTAPVSSGSSIVKPLAIGALALAAFKLLSSKRKK